MTRSRVLTAFHQERSKWLVSPSWKNAVRNLRHEVLEKGKAQAANQLLDSSDWRVLLLALAPGKSLPIHDHPNTRALLWIVEGAVHAAHYDVLERSVNGRSALLAMRGRKTLEPGDVDWVGASRHNLHSLTSGGDFSLVFSIRQRLGPDTGQSMFAFLREPDPGDDTGVALIRSMAEEKRHP